MNKTFLEAIRKLKQGGVIIYPTETAYGLGADATNQRAVNLVFVLKKRPKSKSLPLIASSLAMVRRFCLLSKKELALAKKYWPGPLTLVLRVKKNCDLARGTVAQDKTVAVRVSGHPLARRLARALGQPLVSTSANLAGRSECYSVAEVHKQLGWGILKNVAVLDGGRLSKRKPTTIARVQENGAIKILRQGVVRVKFTFF